jgi:hypothetical protein
MATNLNLIQEEIKRTLNVATLATIQSKPVFFSRLLSKNIKLEYTKLQFCLWFCMGVKLGL